MLVRLPNGTITKVEEIVPIIETFIKFNGKKQLISEPISNENPNVKSNGIKFYHSKPDNPSLFGYNLSGFTIGNLSSEDVEEISRCLLEKGSYDFSKFEFQKQQLNFYDYVIDDGISKPYFNNTVAFWGLTSGMHNCGGNIFDSVPSNDDGFDEDIEECYDYEDFDDDYDFITDED